MINLLRRNDGLLVLIAPAIALVWLVFHWVFEDTGSVLNSTWGLLFWIERVLAFILILTSILLLNRVVENSILLGRISSFPMFFAVVLLCLLSLSDLTLSASLAVLLQVPLLRYLLDLPEGQRTQQLSFNTGLIIGGLFILQPWSILLSFVVMQSMASTGLLDIRRAIIHFLGLAVPLYFFLSFSYLFQWPYSLSRPTWDTSVFIPESYSFYVLGIVLLVLVVSVSAFISVLQISTSTTLRERRKWYLILTYAFIGGVVGLQVGWSGGLIYLLIPSSIILSRVFLVAKNLRWAGLGLLFLMVLVIMLNFYG